MKAILTVVGKDRPGIVYEVSKKLKEENINILDIDQTLMQEYFTMVVLCDFTKCKKDFSSVQAEFDELGEKENLSIRLQNEKIFNAIYTV